MRVTIDLHDLGPLSSVPTALIAPAPATGPSRLLVLQNPGRVSRHYLEGLINAASRLGIEHRVCELEPIWERKHHDIAGLTGAMTDLIRQQGIRVVLSYICNGMTDFECRDLGGGRVQSLFEQLGVRHLMLWTDHPQWANQKNALIPQLQPLLRSANNVHFVKSEAAAIELRELLGWANCFSLPMGEDAEILRPVEGVTPDYDLAAIVGSPPQPIPLLEPFLEHDEPDQEVMVSLVAQDVRTELDRIWDRDVPPELRLQLHKLGRDWLDRRASDLETASVRHLPQLESDHPAAVAWLRVHPTTYFDAVEQLWRLTGWQRTFYIRYLARHFCVAVFGSDWSSVGVPGGGWVPYHDQPHYYARAKVALNISQAGEEEGMSHKPFQIAASGVAMAHVYRKGLEDCFEIDREIMAFHTPAEARQAVATLIRDDDLRAELAHAARRRLERDHTWDRRLIDMFQRAGLDFNAFNSNAHCLAR